MPVVYKHTDPITWVVRYIGETSLPPDQRLKQHLAEARNTEKRNHKLHWLRSLNTPPIVEVLEECESQEKAYERECYWIALFRSYGHKLVNGTDGGDRGPILVGKDNPIFGKPRPDSTKQKISAANTGKRRTPEFKAAKSLAMCGEKNHFFGKTHSAECIEENRRAQTGKSPSAETRKKLSAATTGENNPFFGKTHSPETIIAIQEANWKRSTTGVPGVSFNKGKNKYTAYVGMRGKRVWLGDFLTLEEATQVRKRAEKESVCQKR